MSETPIYDRLVAQWRWPIPRCHYCDNALGFTRDHIVPRAFFRQFGPDVTDETNIVPACEPCNRRKGDARATCDCETCTAAWKPFENDKRIRFVRVVDPATGLQVKSAFPAYSPRPERVRLKRSIGDEFPGLADSRWAVGGS